jgi:hypothetical protein
MNESLWVTSENLHDYSARLLRVTWQKRTFARPSPDKCSFACDFNNRAKKRGTLQKSELLPADLLGSP